MTATQNGPQVSGSGSGNGNGGARDDNETKIRKFEVAIIILVGIIVGFLAGLAKRMMDHATGLSRIVVRATR